MGKKNEWEEAMKTYEKLIEELMETSPVNSMGGGFSVGQASSNSGNLDGYDPVMPWGMHRRKKRKKKLVGEMFAGCPVFEVSSDDFTKCSHGRNRYERWGKKMNMEEGENQNIRTYVHRNPGKPIIIKDSTYGTMSYLIPRQNVNESFELDEKFTISGYNKKGKKIGGYTALGQRDADSAAKTLKKHFGAHKVEIESGGKNTKTESFELDEGKMSEIDARRKEGQSPEQIAKGMKVDVKDVKKILGIRKTRPLTDPMRPQAESVEVEEGSFNTLFKTTGKDNEGKERHGWSDFAKGRLNKTRERVQKRKEEKKSKYNAMTPAEQKAHDRMWAEVKADKIEKMSRG